MNNIKYKRVVAKFGTSLLTGGTDHLDDDIVSSLVAQVARLHKQGLELVLVSSGAIALGRHKLGMTQGVSGVARKQVLASVGQSRLMNVYERLFSQNDIVVAQALLTRSLLADRAGYLNARNTLLTLLDLRIICIVNENDVVAVDELQETKFGDNDNLSAMVANLVDADLLLLLTNTGGLYTADPNLDPEATLVPEVWRVDAEIERMASDTAQSLGTGGMITKVEAAKLATSSGVTAVIADGREPEVLVRLIAGESVGTRFLPTTGKLESRKRWMVSGLSNRGGLGVDGGAARALRKQNRSLLPTGIKKVEGEFQRGDVVTIYDDRGSIVGCGITNYSASDVAAIKGVHSDKIVAVLGYDYGAEVVHRNNLVIL